MQPQALAGEDRHLRGRRAGDGYEAQVLGDYRVRAEIRHAAREGRRGGGLPVGDERVELGVDAAAADAAVAHGLGQRVLRKAADAPAAEAYIDRVSPALHRGYDGLGAPGESQNFHVSLPIPPGAGRRRPVFEDKNTTYSIS